MFLFPCWHWPFRWCSGPRQPMHQAALAAIWPRCRSGVSVHWTRPATSGRQGRSWARRGSLTFDRTGREGEPRIFPVRSTFRRECADRCGDGDRRAVRSTAARRLRRAERPTSSRRGATSGSARRAIAGGRHRSSAPGAAGRRRRGVAAPCPGSAPTARVTGRSTATAGPSGSCGNGGSMTDRAVWLTFSGGRLIPPPHCAGGASVDSC